MKIFRASEVYLGIAAGIAWLVFSWQYGFMISPDGWFRGVLAKSIVNGTPYWINLNQGYSYDHAVWHHNANHEPLLPVILAALFALYGPFISFLNIISALCAGILLCPLLTISRRVFGSWSIGLVAYLLVALHLSTEFFKEAMSGLSFPSAMLVLLLYLVISGAIVEQPSWRRIVAAGVCLAFYYLSRGEAFAVCAFVVAVQFFVAPRVARPSLIRAWIVCLALVAPWAIRKWILFGDPFFSHMSPLLFAAHGNDLWSFPEEGYPSRALFVERFGWTGLLEKLFVGNPLSAWPVVQTVSQGWAPYIGLLALAFPIFPYFQDKSSSHRFLALSFFAAGLGSALILTQAPILDRRVTLIVSLFGLTLALGTLERLSRLLLRTPHSARLLSASVLCWFGLSNIESVEKFPHEYLRYTFSTEDELLERDPSVAALNSRFNMSDVILAPFAKAQYLSFATGIGIVEIPANFSNLKDPKGFLKRFGIDYSLVNVEPGVSRPGWEVFGHTVGHSVHATTTGERTPLLLNSELSLTVPAMNTRRENVSISDSFNRSAALGNGVYVDSFHGGQSIRQMLRNVLPEAFYASDSLSASHAQLSQARVLLVGIGGEQSALSAHDRRELEDYLRGGGSLALFGHVWVWVTQNSHALSDHPLNQFLSPIGCVLAPEGDVVSPAYNSTTVPFSFSENSVFSSIVCSDPATVLLRTPSGVPTAITGRTLWGGRVLIWGHDEPLIAAQNGDSKPISQLRDLVAQFTQKTAP